MEFRTINGERIRKQRGQRTVREVAAASGGAFSHASLCCWEAGDHKPREENIGPLLRALGCGYEDITVEVDLGISR